MDRENCIVVTRGSGGGRWSQGVKGVIYMVMDKQKRTTQNFTVLQTNKTSIKKKKNEEHLYILIWNELQYILLSYNSKIQDKLRYHLRKKRGLKYVHTFA